MYRFADLPSIAVGLAVSLTLTAMLPARSEDRTAGPTIPSPLPAEALPALREKPTPSSDPPALERLRAKGLTVKGGGWIGRELRFWLLRSRRAGRRSSRLRPRAFCFAAKSTRRTARS